MVRVDIISRITPLRKKNKKFSSKLSRNKQTALPRRTRIKNTQKVDSTSLVYYSPENFWKCVSTKSCTSGKSLCKAKQLAT